MYDDQPGLRARITCKPFFADIYLVSTGIKLKETD